MLHLLDGHWPVSLLMITAEPVVYEIHHVPHSRRESKRREVRLLSFESWALPWEVVPGRYRPIYRRSASFPGVSVGAEVRTASIAEIRNYSIPDLSVDYPPDAHSVVGSVEACRRTAPVIPPDFVVIVNRISDFLFKPNPGLE